MGLKAALNLDSASLSYSLLSLYIYVCVCMAVTRNTGLSLSPAPLGYKPLSRALCYKPLSRASVQSTVVFNRLVARMVCRKTRRFCHKPCRKKAARACYKPDVFEALPYIYIYICAISYGLAKVHVGLYAPRLRNPVRKRDLALYGFGNQGLLNKSAECGSSRLNCPTFDSTGCSASPSSAACWIATSGHH